MYDTSTAAIWNSEFAFTVADRIASVHGLYCGPAAVAWIAAVWNAKAGQSYDVLKRLRDKTLFPDGPRAFIHNLPAFKSDLNSILLRETHGQLRLSQERYYRYDIIHQRIRATGMPFIVRIPTASLRDGLHYVTLFQTIRTDTSYRCYWQDNGVFHSDESMQEGISVSIRSAKPSPFFFWGARQVERN
jgi:hypothetical protein